MPDVTREPRTPTEPIPVTEPAPAAGPAPTTEPALDTEPARAPEPPPAPESAPAVDPGTATGPGTASGPLLPREESDELGRRLHHAVTGFVDAPRASVEEADRVLEEIAARLTDAVARRRRDLRTSWQGTGEGTGEEAAALGTDTEQLRLALRDYRELADRLAHA
ncbi:hypothetical protein [Streptomyces olivaceus]|uniref:hypothetical protein n=1 Tax=Streptomyces olivaceus TaxID=47716 RepID=UPI001884F774|nr:hypothetical protein [Streptomyces olivaceus]